MSLHSRDKKKGKDPCVEKPDCQHCKILTPERLAQLSTPSYKLKKEKRETKSSIPSKDLPSSFTLFHPCGPGTCVGSGGRGWPEHHQVAWFEWTACLEEDKRAMSSKLVKRDKPVKSTSHRPSSSTDSRIDELD